MVDTNLRNGLRNDLGIIGGWSVRLMDNQTGNFFSFPNSIWECLPRRSASNTKFSSEVGGFRDSETHPTLTDVTQSDSIRA